MNKLQNYFIYLILSIIVFGILQTISIIAVIILQLFSIFILLYGIFGIALFYKSKEDKNVTNNNDTINDK